MKHAMRTRWLVKPHRGHRHFYMLIIASPPPNNHVEYATYYTLLLTFEHGVQFVSKIPMLKFNSKIQPTCLTFQNSTSNVGQRVALGLNKLSEFNVYEVHNQVGQWLPW